MNADERRYQAQAHHPAVIGGFFPVYNEFGCGFFEAVYREAMVIAFQEANLLVEREFPFAVRFRGRVIGEFKADLVVEHCAIVELKAVKALNEVHEAQVLNYL